jgi:hypothetical protein
MLGVLGSFASKLVDKEWESLRISYFILFFSLTIVLVQSMTSSYYKEIKLEGEINYIMWKFYQSSWNVDVFRKPKI